MDIFADKVYNYMMKLDLLKSTMRTYGMKRLAEKASVSRTSLYNLLSGENFEGDTLEKIAQVLNLELCVLGQTPTYENVCHHLASYGAPLLHDKSKPVTMSLEETAKWGLQLSKRDGLLESVMPFFLVKNFSKINKAQFLSQLNEESQFQLLGYYLDLGAEYMQDKQLKKFTNSFYQKKFLSLQLGQKKPSQRALGVLKSKHNPLAKKWNVLSLGSLEDYFSRFRKWDKIA